MEVNIGLIGLGTIGSGVVKIIKENSELIEKRTGIKLRIKKACDRDAQRVSSLNLSEVEFTTNYDDIINDSSVHVVIELIGGYEPARTVIEKALKSGKHVVTANKAVISKFGKDLFSVCDLNKTNIKFEASVGGCIPIIRTLQQSYVSEEFSAIYGIVNGTTNYILTKMAEGKSYSDALKKAQENGFAEADPSFDVEGKDSAQKLTILSMLAFNSNAPEEIYTEGITMITKNDIVYASELGYVIKLLAIAKRTNNELDLRVHPTMIPVNSELASVSNEFNGIYLKGKNTSESMFYGRGAGQLPTASVVVSDAIDLAKKIRNKHYVSPVSFFNNLRQKPIDEIKSRYYFRFRVLDKPGVIAKIAKELGDNNISIAGVSQKEENLETVPLIIITHSAIEKDVKRAVEAINKLDVVKEKTVVIRIEDIS